MSDPRDSEPTVQIVGGALDEHRGLESASLFDHSPAKAVLGRYVVIERIGRGGGGVVYRAYDPQLDRGVALKVLRPDVLGGSSPAWAERMLAEAQSIARLCHPNIVAVHDVGEIPPDHPQFAAGVFIVMELIDGETLSEWIDRARPWALDRKDAALVSATRAMTIARARPTGDLPLAVVTLAMVLRVHGRSGEAAAMLDEVARADGLDDSVRAELERARAGCARDGGDLDRARTELGAAIARLVALYGEHAPGLVEPLVELAELEQAGAVDQARAAAMRARTIAGTAELDPQLLARAERVLAAVRARE